MTDADLKTTTYTYDKQGNKLSETDPLLQTTRYEYNELNLPTRTIYHDGTSVETRYDLSGRLVAKTDENNNTVAFGYDELGRMTSIINALEDETAFTYDAEGRKLTQTDAEKRTTRWTYDAFGNLLSRTLPLDQSESFSYDPFGRLAGHTDFNGQTTTYFYDGNDRLIKIVYDDGTIDEFAYDDVGNRVRTTMTTNDGVYTSTYDYDARGRLTQEVQPDGTTLAYTYDKAGNRTRMTITDAAGTATTGYTYDKLNRLESVTDNDAQTTRYAYDAVGNRASVVHANGNAETYAYDVRNRLLNLTLRDAQNSVIASFEYTLDDAGLRTGILEHDGRRTEYAYDALNRLLSENIADPVNGDFSAEYTYDKVGNRVYSVVDGVSTAYSYDLNDRLTQQGGTIYTYDDNGNTLSETLDYNTTAYTYNAKNQLIEVQEGSRTTAYRYNIDGIRTAKITDGDAVAYVIDDTERYAQVVRETSNRGRVDYTYGDDLISQKRGGTTYDHHYDGLGSTRFLSDANGTITDAYDYEAFGKLIGRIGDTNNSYLFTGEQYDEETGNYYLRARYYDELIGRFTQQDTYGGSMSDPATLHKYLYANANPVMYVDPTGYYSMVDASLAMSVRNMLVDMQFEGYTTFFNALMNAEDSAQSYIPAIGGVGIGFKLLLRFSREIRNACRMSFDGETLVSTENGLISIINIKIDDNVWAYNEQNKTTSLHRVTHLRMSEGTKELVDIALQNGEIITATTNHPFWSVDMQQWVKAGELTIENILFDIHEQNITIKEIERYTKDTKVYNLTIDNDHTYYVGINELLGHNASCPIDKISGDYLKKKNIDAEEFKKEYLGRKAPIAHYDLYKNKSTKEIWIMRKRGKGTPIQTGVYLGD